MDVRALVVDLAVRYGFQVLGAIVILGAGVAVARWLGRLLNARLTRQQMEPPMRALIVRTVRIVIMLFALVVALDKFGFQIAPLVAGIGVAGIGVGFALQGVLSNLMAGLTIIFTKPFRVGEHIAVVGVHGDVASIELFSTTLLHPDRSRIVIPNRKIVGEILHNFGTMRQITLSISVAQPGDVASLLAGVREVVARNARVLKDPTPLVGLAQVGDGGVQVAVKPWVAVPDVPIAGAEIYQALLDFLRARGLTVTPQYHVRLVDGAHALS